MISLEDFDRRLTEKLDDVAEYYLHKSIDYKISFLIRVEIDKFLSALAEKNILNLVIVDVKEINRTIVVSFFDPNKPVYNKYKHIIAYEKFNDSTQLYENYLNVKS